MFKANKYTKWYFKIVDNANKRENSKGYFEIHHIIPRSLGGSDDKENKVKLTPREHFLVHVLLVKMLEKDTKHYRNMLHAIMLFKGENSYQNRYINSRIYENLKKEYSAIRSSARKGVKLSEAHKQKISESLKGHKTEESTKELIRIKAKERKRTPLSKEHKKKLSDKMKNKRKTEEHKKNISLALKSRNSTN